MTTTITLLHQTFNCSPQAKQNIKTYITDIKDHVSHNNHYDESVIEDIIIACEHKFSTIIAQKADQTITEDDVRTVINQLGTPEFLDEQEHTTQTDRSLPRKLYRNGEKARIGGVASGLAVYFSMSIWAMRLIFVLLIMTPLSSVIIYLILRYLLPETQTKGDTLRMYGKPVNLHSLTNTDNYIRTRVLSLLKTLLIIGGVILGGILSLATLAIVMGSIRQGGTANYIHNPSYDTQENYTLPEVSVSGTTQSGDIHK